MQYTIIHSKTVNLNISDDVSLHEKVLLTIFVGHQGILIVLHGLRKEEAQNEWKRWFSTATRTYELYSSFTKSPSSAPLSQNTESQPTSSSLTYDMQTLSKLSTLPTEVSSETDFKSGIDVEKRKAPQKPKTNLLDRELLAREASSRLLLTVLSFQGNIWEV